MVRDAEGRERLDADAIKTRWQEYWQRAAEHYGWDDAQRKQAEQVRQRSESQLENFVNIFGEDIDQYFKECDRLRAARQDSTYRDVEHRWKWMLEKEAELRTTPQPWFKALDVAHRQYQQDLHAVGNESQRKRDLPYLPDPADISGTDRLVSIWHIVAGACLMLGLFTRPAAIAAALFLLSVLVTQPPWVPGAEVGFMHYQLVEFVAALLLAATGAGMFAGLDFFLARLWKKKSA